MKTVFSRLLVIGLALGSASLAQAQTKKAPPKNCVTISGTIAVTVTSAPGASQTTVVGTVLGTLQGSVSATVTDSQPQTDGTVLLKAVHSFVTNEGFLLQTVDTAKLTPVPGLANVFQLTTEYKVTKGTGRFANAKGTFTNHGEADLGKGLFSLRYDGKICGVTP